MALAKIPRHERLVGESSREAKHRFGALLIRVDETKAALLTVNQLNGNKVLAAIFRRKTGSSFFAPAENQY